MVTILFSCKSCKTLVVKQFPDCIRNLRSDWGEIPDMIALLLNNQGENVLKTRTQPWRSPKEKEKGSDSNPSVLTFSSWLGKSFKKQELWPCENNVVHLVSMWIISFTITTFDRISEFLSLEKKRKAGFGSSCNQIEMPTGKKRVEIWDFKVHWNFIWSMNTINEENALYGTVEFCGSISKSVQKLTDRWEKRQKRKWEQREGGTDRG